MLNRCHLLLFLVVYLISSVHGEHPSPETLIDMTCFDPTCSTPFLIGELIVDFPHLSLSKGTQAQVIAQSSDHYRIQVGEATYDIPLSVLEITKHIHEERALWRAKLPPINPPIDFSVPLSEPEQEAESPASAKFDSTPKDLPVLQDLQPSEEGRKEEELSDFEFRSAPSSKESQKSILPPPLPPSPPVELKVPKSDDSKISPDNKDSQPNQTSQKIQTESPVKQFIELHQKEEMKINPSPEIKQQERKSITNKQTKVRKETKDTLSTEKSKTGPKVIPAPEIKTMQQPLTRVESVEQEEQPHVPKVASKVTPVPAPETKVVGRKPPPEKPSKMEDIKVIEVEKQPSVGTAPKMEEIKPVEQTPQMEEVKAEDDYVVEVITQPSHIDSTDRKEVVMTPVLDSVELVTETGEKARTDESSPRIEEAKTLGTPEIEPVTQPQLAETIPEMEEIHVTSAPEVQQPSEKIIDQAPPKMEKDVNEIPTPKDEPIPQIPNQNNSASKLSPEREESIESPSKSEQSLQSHAVNEVKQPENHDTTSQNQLSDEFEEMFREELLPTSPSLVDITDESIFFHCLSLAANGTLNGAKSPLAAAVLTITRRYFTAAQTLLGKLPDALVSPLDSLFTLTLKTPLVFFTTWALFITSVIVTYLVIKLANKLYLLRFSSTNTDDPTQRSLSQWLAVEENANLLADSLADKEEAYGRLIVWSTKVSERYENENRHAATSSKHIHNQLRDAKAALSESLRENKELKDAHDALVEQLSTIKNEAAFNIAHLREEINTLNKRLEDCARKYGESIAEKERLNEEIVNTLSEEKAVLVREVKSYQNQVESAEKTVNELKEANQRFEEDLAIRDRELLSVKEAFMELKAAELRNKNKKAAAFSVTSKNVTSEDRVSTDGWEVEDDAELDAIIEEVEGGQQEEAEELKESDLQSAFDNLKEIGRLKVALEEAEKLAHNVASAKDQETKLRIELEEKVDSLKSEVEEMRQKLRTATEERDAAKTKLEVLSDYFHKREAERQKDLGRKELSQSEMSQEISLLREKLQTAEVETNTLREQLSSARRELAETERANRRHVSELDKRLHENRLASRTLENQVKDLRTENTMLRQKMFVGDRGGVFPPGILPPPPPPPPPPQVLTLATSKHPENRSISRQSEKSLPSHPAQVNHHHQQQPPPPFLPFPLAGPGGSQFIPPPPPPGMIPPGLFNSQIDPSRSGQRPGSTTSGSNRSGKQPR